jgi:hypothetical protein
MSAKFVKSKGFVIKCCEAENNDMASKGFFIPFGGKAKASAANDYLTLDLVRKFLKTSVCR